MHSHTLKHDALGTTRIVEHGGPLLVERDTRTAMPGVRWLARRLARREVAALTALASVDQVPRLVGFDGAVVRRSYVHGTALNEQRPASRRYFARALRVLRAMHRAGVTHNDLAKEANWIVGPDDTAGVVDFQVATLATRRTRAFRAHAYEDLRHLLKHKRTYYPAALTAGQRRVLTQPTLAARVWRRLWKPVYRLVTRRILGWPERRGPAERKT